MIKIVPAKSSYSTRSSIDEMRVLLFSRRFLREAGRRAQTVAESPGTGTDGWRVRLCGA